MVWVGLEVLWVVFVVVGAVTVALEVGPGAVRVESLGLLQELVTVGVRFVTARLGLAVVWTGHGVLGVGPTVVRAGSTGSWVGLVGWAGTGALRVGPVVVRVVSRGWWAEPVELEVRLGTLWMGPMVQ